MVLPTATWPRHHWKWIVSLVFLFALFGILIGTFAWRRGTDAAAKSNPAPSEADNEPKLMLSQYTWTNARLFHAHVYFARRPGRRQVVGRSHGQGNRLASLEGSSSR